MDPWVIVLSALVGYFIGSVSFSRLVTRVFSPAVDLDQVVITDQQTGDTYHRQANASTASMALGWQKGCLISLLDMLKVTLPVVAFKLIFPNQAYYLIVAVFGLVGNNWPVYYRFKGGSGISAIYGGLLAVDPLAVVVTPLAGFIVGMLILRSFTVGFLLSLLLIIPWLWVRFHQPVFLIYGILINLIYLVLFAKDIKEYLRPGVRRMSEREVMEQMPMGRGMLKIMAKLKLDRKRS